jgi:hypothetical protein
MDTHEAAELPSEPTYYLAADVENRFRQYVKGALCSQLNERVSFAWELFEPVLTAFPAPATRGTPEIVASEVQWGTQRSLGYFGERSDEEDAREEAACCGERVARRTVYYGPWEVVDTAALTPQERHG